MADWKYRPRAEREAEAEKRLNEQNQAALREETPEGFASRNVKVITFVVCLAIFLILFGPVNIFWLQKQKQAGEVNGAVMTEADAIRLSSLGKNLRLEDLRQFEGTLNESDSVTIYTVLFDDYVLMAMAPAGDEQIDVCTLTHIDTEEQVDLMTGDVRAFFEAHSE